MSFFSIFIILAINMLLSFVLLYASVQINCINIRNAAKMELLHNLWSQDFSQQN